jgi:hypothetical protein
LFGDVKNSVRGWLRGVKASGYDREEEGFGEVVREEVVNLRCQLESSGNSWVTE